MSNKHRIVISDIHLGYQAKRLNPEEYKEEVHFGDEHFHKFISYYKNLKKDTSWELVINGDFIDFIQINYRINPNESKKYKLSLDEMRYGLNNKEKHVVWKLRKISEIHQLFFKTLSDFVFDGNSLVILKGNHDVEFYWPKVKQEFKTILSEMQKFNSDDEKLDFENRIKIKDWIYYEKDFFYMEHGNQYDDYTSFNNFITPLHPTHIGVLEMPFSHITMRYWTNLTNDIETHGLADWGLKEIWDWFKKQGVKGVITQLIFYFRILIMVIANVKIAHIFSAKIHLKKTRYIQEIAKIHNIEPKVLKKINRMKHTPVGNSLFEALSAFYVEWFFIIVGFFIFLSIQLLFPSTAHFFLGGGFYLISSIAIYLIFSSGRVIEPDEKLVEASEKISKLLSAKYYIFSHTHHHEWIKINKESLYLNTGSWLERGRKEWKRVFHYNLSHILLDGEKKEVYLMGWSPNDMKPIIINSTSEKKDFFDLDNKDNDELKI
ncbi:metallophosphoesterase [bacterium]|nr:metallophosphoesterase [bacterium]